MWIPAMYLLLVSVLYQKPMDPRYLPKPMKWGIDNEKCACITYMRANGHDGLQTTPCGFIIHPNLGWLGASPDAFVTDPSTILNVHSQNLHLRSKFLLYYD